MLKLARCLQTNPVAQANLATYFKITKQIHSEWGDRVNASKISQVEKRIINALQKHFPIS